MVGSGVGGERGSGTISRFWAWTTGWLVMLPMRTDNKGKRMGLGRRMVCVIVYTFGVRALSDKEVAFVTQWSVRA